MAKLKPIAFTVGIMLLIGAALCLYFSLRNLSSIRPASAYEDMGVHTFVPEEVYPVQRENHATGRQKRNHPTTTGEDDYITIGADETAQTYEARQKRTYWTIAGVSMAYLLVWLAVNGLLLYKRRKGM